MVPGEQMTLPNWSRAGASAVAPVEKARSTAWTAMSSAANRAVHQAIVAAARNASLSEIHAALMTRAEQVRAYALRLDDRWQQSIEEHREVLAALEARDPERAGQLLRAHVGHTAATVAAWLADQARQVPNVA